MNSPMLLVVFCDSSHAYEKRKSNIVIVSFCENKKKLKKKRKKM